MLFQWIVDPGRMAEPYLTFHPVLKAAYWEVALHDVSVENFAGVVTLSGPAFVVPFHTKDPQKLELSHAFVKALTAAKEGRVVASHVPRAAALKQALADEHQRKTELLKKQKLSLIHI